MSKSRIEADEKAVLDVVNPFDNEYKDLVHLASGTVASSAVSHDMKTMLEKGKNASINFMKTNIIGEARNIYSTIKKTNLKAFSSSGSKVTSKGSKGQLVAMKNSKIFFAKMVLIPKSRNLHIQDVLKYSLRPFPSSLTTLEGDLIKTQKSKLLDAVENEADNPTVPNLPDGDNARVLDAFAIWQTLTSIPDSFGNCPWFPLQKSGFCVRPVSTAEHKKSGKESSLHPRCSKSKDLQHGSKGSTPVEKISNVWRK